MYTDCLAQLELSLPVNLTPMCEFLLSLGKQIRKSLVRKAKKQNPNILRTIDSFYVMYVFTTGTIDDMGDLLKCLVKEEWRTLPLQI
jgi:hypothetical protein